MKLTVGESYTSKNGHKWECIAVKGRVAWLASYYNGAADGTAYTFNLDGTSICFGLYPEYNIIMSRTVTVYGAIGENEYTMTVTEIDGKPDWSTAKVEGTE